MNFSPVISRLLLAGLLSVLLPTAYGQSYKIEIIIENIAVPKGTIQIRIYNQSNGFLAEGRELRTERFAVNTTTTRFIISNLPVGQYAYALYHDLNNDKKCNLNFMGVPLEPYGFSNNVKPVLSPPSFSDAKFSLNADVVHRIKLLK